MTKPLCSSALLCLAALALCTAPSLAAAPPADSNFFVILKLFPFEEHDAAKAYAAAIRSNAGRTSLVETDKWTGLDQNRWAVALGPFATRQTAEAALRSLPPQTPAATIQSGGARIKD